MGFKEEGARFTSDVKFKDYALNFAAGEASRFSKGDGEDASAKVDLTLSGVASLSANKHRAKAKEMKKFLKLKQKEAFIDEKKAKGTDVKREEAKVESPPQKTIGAEASAQTPSKPEKGTEKADAGKSVSKDVSKKSVSKEKRAAANKTAVAKMLRAKGMIGNDLGSEKATGDALKDGNTGAVRVVTEILNPATYLKGLFAKIAALIAPHVMVVLMFLIVFMILVSLVVGMFTSINSVSTTVTGFVSRFSGRGRILSEESLTDEEIDAIVDDSGATGRQEEVIRFALSRVGYPYSQANRASGYAYDCSSLAFYSWQAGGVDISYGGGYPPTAAAEASKLYSKGEVVNSTRLDVRDMEPGDLIFYGGHDNGRFLGIYHVAVYVGNGEVVEALNEDHGVVYQTLRTKNVILVLRP